MKLKTLKDFDLNPCGSNYCHSDSKESLKEEAIKWVKSWKKERNETTIDELYWCLTYKINGFTHFFNITEEDIKDNSNNEGEQ